MANSKYEKYVVRKLIPPDPKVAWSRKDLGWMAPYHFMSTNGPVKEANTMAEFMWVTKDCAFGVTTDRPPHKHDCDEIFIFQGTNPENVMELGSDCEFWMGEGADTEKITFNTTTLIYVPKGLVHLPVFYRNFKKPSLLMVIGLNIGNALQNNIKHPVRGVENMLFGFGGGELTSTP
jgi:hypothetical protein